MAYGKSGRKRGVSAMKERTVVGGKGNRGKGAGMKGMRKK